MILPVLVTPPAETPISVDEARDQVRAPPDEADARLAALIGAAVIRLDGWSGILGRCLVTQRWRQDFWGWGCHRLPFPDVSNVVVTYRQPDGTEVEVDEDEHRIDALPLGPHVAFRSSWSGPSLLTGGAAPVTVTFDAGFGSAEDVPAALKQAILIHVEALYDRVPEADWKPAYNALVAPFRLARV